MTETRRMHPIRRRDSAPPETSVLAASVRVVEAAAHLVAERIDLARVEVRDAARTVLRRGAWLAFALVAFLAAGSFALAAILWALAGAGVPLSIVLAVGALLCAGSGAALWALSRDRPGDTGAPP